MLRSLLLAAVVCCNGFLLLNAQPMIFSKHYAEPGETSDEATHIATQDGGSLIASVQHPNMAQNYSITLFKTDGSGAIQWTKKFATSRPGFKNVVQSADGTYFLCYSEFQFGHYYEAIRLDQNGNVLFDRRIDLPAQHHVTWKVASVAKMDSGYYVGCSVFDTTSGMYKWNLTELSASGNVVWSENYHAGAFLSALHSIELCNNGDVLLFGSDYDIPTQSYAGMVTRVAPNGNLLWNTRFKNTGHDLFPVGAEPQGNGFVVAVQDYQQSAGIAAVDFMKMDSAGALVWEIRYTNTGPNSSLLPHDIIKSGGNEYIIVAQRSGPQLGSVFLKVDGSGQYLDSRFYADYTIYSIDNHGQWMYSLTGTRDSLNQHFIALKTVDDDGVGCDDTTAAFGVGPTTFTANSNTTSAAFSLAAVNGTLQATNANLVPFTDCAVTGVNDQTETNAGISLYPVPANDQLFVTGTSPIERIEIIDVNGAIVQTQRVNSSTCIMNTEGLAEGVYFVRVYDATGTHTVRTVVAR